MVALFEGDTADPHSQTAALLLSIISHFASTFCSNGYRFTKSNDKECKSRPLNSGLKTTAIRGIIPQALHSLDSAHFIGALPTVTLWALQA